MTYVIEMAERLDTAESYARFDHSLKRPACQATLKSCDTMKQSVGG